MFSREFLTNFKGKVEKNPHMSRRAKFCMNFTRLKIRKLPTGTNLEIRLSGIYELLNRIQKEKYKLLILWTMIIAKG